MDNVATIGAEQNMVADPNLRSIEDIIADLSRPVNPRRLRIRKQDGKQITYLPWYKAPQFPINFTAQFSMF
jgi:hypothetical protein